MTPVPALVFSDFTCPFSYVAEAALWRLAGETPLELAYRAFELYPAPRPLPFDTLPRRVEAARPLANELGLELRTPTVLPRTRKAHELAALAAEKGLEQPMREALYRAVFRDGLDVGRIDVLVRLASGVGLDTTEAKVVLDIDRLTEQVATSTSLALEAGVQGVPTVVVGSGPAARTISGALPLALLRAALAGQ
jgi:predicted DsbA family dithiol-disulfide isomerase